MSQISSEEKLRRRRVNESVIGTNSMEGLSLDTQTLELMRRFEEGELDRTELSAAIDAHVAQLLKQQAGNSAELRGTLAGAA